jgi:hypothetical protein
MKEHEPQLKERAAFERGNCRWWQYTWPLHKEYYGAVHRIICPYRSSVNRFAFDSRDEFISLDDTTVVFVERESAISVYTLEALLNSRLLTFRYRGIGKLTAQNSWEYFDYGLARLPIKLPSSGHEKSQCTALHKLALAAHQNNRKRPDLIAEIDAVVYEYYAITQDESKVIDAELEWSSFAEPAAEERQHNPGDN